MGYLKMIFLHLEYLDWHLIQHHKSMKFMSHKNFMALNIKHIVSFFFFLKSNWPQGVPIHMYIRLSFILYAVLIQGLL
jgi:hypothetical protein